MLSGPEREFLPLFSRYCYRRRSDGNVGSAFRFHRETHLAFTKRKERVVATDAYVCAGVKFGSALTDEDLAAVDALTAKALHAETLTGAIATVAR